MARGRPGSARPSWRYQLRRGLWAGLDLLFPPRCGGCNQPNERFCARCCSQVAYLPQSVCHHCGYPVEQADLCVACHTGRSLAPLQGLRSATFFEGPVQRALHRLKYQRDICLADALAQLLAQHWQALALPGEMFIPVPLSAARLRERGYNQAGLLAQSLADLTGLPCRPTALHKVRHTVSQVGLSATERQDNVAGAFVAEARWVAGRAVVVVDDVATTGSTLVACAQALHQAGAHTVWGYTASRARFFHTGATKYDTPAQIIRV